MCREPLPLSWCVNREAERGLVGVDWDFSLLDRTAWVDKFADDTAEGFFLTSEE